MQHKLYCVYILTNVTKNVLYVGITGKALAARVWEHKQKLVSGFTKKYNVNLLMYYEVFEEPLPAIAREKQLKGGSRYKKIELINKFNPQWKDLYSEVV